MSEASGERSPGKEARGREQRVQGPQTAGPVGGAAGRHVCRRAEGGGGRGTGSCGAREAQPSLAGHPFLGLGFLK